MTDTVAPYGWSAKSPAGVTGYFTGALPDGVTGATAFASIDDFEAAVSAARAAAFNAQIPSAPSSISRRQFFQQLAIQGTITETEALAAVQAGAVPAAMQALIAALPQASQFGAMMMIAGASEFDRGSPLTAQLGQAEGWTTAQIDALWTAAAAL